MAVIELLGTDKKTLDPLNALLHTLGAFCTHLRLVRSMCRVITDDESRVRAHRQYTGRSIRPNIAVPPHWTSSYSHVQVAFFSGSSAF